MATYKELKVAVDKVAAIKIGGFDNNWLLKAFARKQALINIKEIKRYTDKYNLIIQYLMTGDESIRDEVRKAAAATSAAAYAASATSAAAYAASATSAAAYAASAASAAAYAAYAASAAAYAASAASAAAYAASAARNKAISKLEEMTSEYIALLDTEAIIEEMTLTEICKELGRDVKVIKQVEYG